MQYIIEIKRRMLGEGRVGNRKFDKVNWQKIWHSDIFFRLFNVACGYCTVRTKHPKCCLKSLKL